MAARGKLSALFFGGDDDDDFRSLLTKLEQEDKQAGEGARPENALAVLLTALSDVLERGSSDAAWGEIVEGMQRTFGCSAATIYRLTRDPGLRNLAGWRLRPIAGKRREEITARDLRALPALLTGGKVPYDRSAAEAAVRQCIAVAFEERRFVGCDIEPTGIVPITKESDDLGDGRISCYAIPLIYRQKRGRFSEKKVVGVAALEAVPVVYGMSGLVGTLEALLAHAMMLPVTQQRDAVTGMMTEEPFRAEMQRWFDFARSIQRRSRSGAGIPLAFIFGMPDLLTSAYRMEARADSLLLSDVKFGIGTVVTNLLHRYSVRYGDGGVDTLTWGFAGNLAEQFFCVGLPGVTKNGALEFAKACKEEIIRYPFKFEERLPLGQITASQLVVEIGIDGFTSPSKLLDTALPELNRIDREQRAKVGGDLDGLVNVVASFEEGAFRVLASGGSKGTD